VGALAFHTCRDADRFAAIEILSPSGNLREAAANLFAAMRRLDALGLDRIIAQPFPDSGLGRAINDRLRRAAHR
jgi:L-threonylcarbamoyladenylate synthase